MVYTWSGNSSRSCNIRVFSKASLNRGSSIARLISQVTSRSLDRALLTSRCDIGQSTTGVRLSNSEKRSGYLQTRWIGCCTLRYEHSLPSFGFRWVYLDDKILDTQALSSLIRMTVCRAHWRGKRLKSFLQILSTAKGPRCHANILDYKLVFSTVFFIDEKSIDLYWNNQL